MITLIVTVANHIDYEKWINHHRGEAVNPVFRVFFFNETLTNMAWNGHPGGMEEIRQKRWTVVGILPLIRESKSCNTRIKTLAQGDNQVDFALYKLLKGIPLEEHYESIGRNNKNIMQAIREGVKLGLIINEDETYYIHLAECAYMEKF